MSEHLVMDLLHLHTRNLDLLCGSVNQCLHLPTGAYNELIEFLNHRRIDIVDAGDDKFMFTLNGYHFTVYNINIETKKNTLWDTEAKQLK